MRITRVVLLACVLGCFAGAAAGDDKPEAAKPRTPWECRQEALQEMRKFREQKGPDRPAEFDEHVWKAQDQSFRELQGEVFFLLVSAGDKDAIARAIKVYDLDNADDKAWAEKVPSRFAPDTVRDLARALDAHRPDLAARVRERLLLARRLEPDEPPRLFPRDEVERLTLPELKKEAKEAEGGGERRWAAVVRWARLEPKEATHWLAERVNDKAEDINVRFYAAHALALLGDGRGLDWLKDAALANVGLGGSPGAALLDAGERGEEIYFRLIAEHEKAHPDKELPYGLGDAGEWCPQGPLFRNLERLLSVKGESAAFKFRDALGRRALPARPLSVVIEHLKKKKYDDIYLVGGVRRSLIDHGPADADARRLAGIWVDEMLRSADAKQWDLGAELFVRARLGTPAVAAAAARRRLGKHEDPRWDCRVLGEAGKTEDAVPIWEAAHRPRKEKPLSWYADRADAWAAVIRLTNHLPEPAEPK
jgi:hypothetical protein